MNNMLYAEFINKAVDLTVEQADNGLFYVDPLWKNILYDNQLNIEEITDRKEAWSDVLEVLKLEVEKRNTQNSVKPYVLDWVYEIITAKVEPAVTQEETEYLKALTEYLKTKNEGIKDEEWDKFKTT